jgi:hypothetical protein
MIEKHNKIIEKKGLFEEDYEFSWFQVGKNFHKCFLFCVGLYGIMFFLHADIVWVEF